MRWQKERAMVALHSGVLTAARHDGVGETLVEFLRTTSDSQQAQGRRETT